MSTAANTTFVRLESLGATVERNQAELDARA